MNRHIVRSPQYRTRQVGVGLIEVMVAVLVLSIAFLGIAALQARSLSTNNSAMARSMATIASYSVLDAMRLDVTAARAGTYNRVDAAAVTADACPAGDGTLAGAQVSQWCNQLAASLGAVKTTTGQINCTDAAVTADCTVTISYDDTRTGTGSALQTVTTRAML